MNPRRLLLIPAVLAFLAMTACATAPRHPSDDFVMTSFHKGEYVYLDSAASAAGRPVQTPRTCYRVKESTGPTAVVRRCTLWDHAYYAVRSWWRGGV